MNKAEREIRERWSRTENAAQISRSRAYADIPFLLGELDSIDALLARRSALDDYTERIDKIGHAIARARDAEDFLARQGYRRCDIPACNCNLWHETERLKAKDSAL